MFGAVALSERVKVDGERAEYGSYGQHLYCIPVYARQVLSNRFRRTPSSSPRPPHLHLPLTCNLLGVYSCCVGLCFRGHAGGASALLLARPSRRARGGQAQPSSTRQTLLLSTHDAKHNQGTTVSAKNGFRIMGHTPCVSGSSRDLKNRVYESMVLCHGSAVEIDILPRSLPHPTLAPPHPSCMGKR